MELSFKASLMGPAMSPFEAATSLMLAKSVALTTSGDSRVSVYNIQCVSAHPKCEGKVVHQLVDISLVLEEVWVLVVYIPASL